MIVTDASAATLNDPIAPRDRLWFGLFLALAAHATLILGISSKSTLPKPQTALSVSLSTPANLAAQERPVQRGRDDTSHATTAGQPEDSTPTPAQPAAILPNASKSQAIASATRLNRKQLIAAIADTRALDGTAPKADRVRRLDETATDPRIKNAESAYLAMWRRKCERLGRVNYPSGNVQGELVMQVSIFSSGHLDYVRIVRSSGSSLLDQAAIDTVKHAAPYQPFSVAMRKAYDRLEFTRTWQYSKFGTDINR